MWNTVRSKSLWAVVLAVLGLASCLNKQSSNADRAASPMRYARLLSMTAHDGQTDVTVADPWRQGKTLQRLTLGGGEERALRPLRRVVVLSTAHCQLLEWLGMADRIVGVCDLKYILIPDIQQRVRDGRVADCGSGMSPDIERIVALRPDAIIASPLEGSGGFGKLGKLGVPIIQAADYMETSALGRAEWMRYYGRLFGCGDRADSLFRVVDSTYQTLRRYASKLPVGRSVLTERKTGGTWYTPGGRSTVASVISDAHGRYAFAADGHGGSLALSAEEIIDKAGESDIWAFKYSGARPMTRTDLLGEYHGYRALKAFRTGEIYECNVSRKPYFEEVPFRPDYLLREMILLLHPGAGLGQLRYYAHL